ncbi:MAG: restriction endonuclease subunit S [Methyloglobulus sp.]
MKEFLEKEVTDLSDSEFESKFQGVDVSIKKQFLDQLTEIRLKKNNEFAIKEVFDDDSFQENAKVVKEVIELLQGFKIRYSKKQQYLSDFFELLLTTGLKQESGQFFTPVPIAQFIIKSIPIDRLVHGKLSKGETNNLLPTIIDYAAGSGHFITESMHEVQRIIDHINPNEFIDATARKLNTWKQDHFDWALQYVYGIEKDYRLVKVGKVGCYLHGDGLAKIIHSDGLGNFTKTPDFKDLLKKTDRDFPQDNKQFDIVVSNPPYSVSAFKNNARKYYTEADFEIYDKLTDQSSEIECLFIERTKQLLKDGGMAGIILPSSILSNTGIYTKAREIILQYFDIVAIAELGSNTFMATGTNTVTLFLRRRNNYDSINIKASVIKAIADVKDVTINGIEKPFSKYIAHVWEGVSFDDYATLLRKQPSDAIKQHEIYQEYLKKINANTEADTWNKIIELETEKLFYFILACKQKIVLVKSGEKQEEKQFLGYEFSNRRGSEGIHPIQRSKAIDECTQLFDADVFDNPEKASTYVYHAFNGDFETPINEKLAKHIFRVDLVDLFTFDRVDFEKNISLAVKKKIKIESKWKLKNLGDLVENLDYKRIPLNQRERIKGEFPYYGATGIIDFVDNYIFDEPLLLIGEDGAKWGANEKSAFIAKGKYWVNNHAHVLKPKRKLIFDKYLVELLNKIDLSEYVTGLNVPKLNQGNLNLIKIPLPPKDIQEKIVAEIEVLETKEAKAKKEIDLLKENVNSIVSNLNKWERISIDKISENLDYKRRPVTKGYREKGDIPYYGASGIVDFVSEYVLDDFVLLISEDGANLKARTLPIAFTASGKIWVNNHAHILKFKVLETHKLVELYLNRTDISEFITGQAQPKLSQTNLNRIKIPLPATLEEQQKIVSQITEIENKIVELESEISTIPHQKESVLKKYL